MSRERELLRRALDSRSIDELLRVLNEARALGVQARVSELEEQVREARALLAEAHKHWPRERGCAIFGDSGPCNMHAAIDAFLSRTAPSEGGAR